MPPAPTKPITAELRKNHRLTFAVAGREGGVIQLLQVAVDTDHGRLA